MKKIHVLVTVALFGPPAGFLVYQALRPVIQSYRSQSWSEQRCTIIERSITWRSTGQDHKFGPEPNLRLAYTYDIDGVRYTGSSARFQFHLTTWNDPPSSVHDPFVPGAVVDCYVNPDDPSEAVLIRDWTFE